MFQPGAAGRPALIFLHEGLGSARQWKDFPWRVARCLDAPALVYSRRGHGGSSPISAPRSPAFMHEEAHTALPRMLARLGERHPALAGPRVLVGHSDGASIALLYAASELDAALTCVVAIAPHVFVEPESITGVQEAVRAFAETDLRDKLGKYHRDPAHTFRAWSDIWLHEDFRAWNIEAALAKISMPMLLIQGSADEYGTMAQCKAIAAAVDAEVDVLELGGCGHNPPRGRPQSTLDAIVSFVARHH
nr:alpha/beta hydrolase [Pseudenhygromyxa sp. WMMC2535]